MLIMTIIFSPLRENCGCTGRGFTYILWAIPVLVVQVVPVYCVTISYELNVFFFGLISFCMK